MMNRHGHRDRGGNRYRSGDNLGDRGSYWGSNSSCSYRGSNSSCSYWGSDSSCSYRGSDSSCSHRGGHSHSLISSLNGLGGGLENCIVLNQLLGLIQAVGELELSILKVKLSILQLILKLVLELIGKRIEIKVLTE
jgi:hypothetical protein